MKLKKIILFVLISKLLFSCVTTRAPIWVKEFGQRTFSKDGIEGIGFAKFDKKNKATLLEARNSAYNEAIKNLAIKLKTEVKGVIQHKMEDKISYVNKKYQQQATDQIDSLTNVMFETLLGRKYFEEYIDYKNSLYWVYVWTTKAELYRVIEEELQKQELQNTTVIKSAIKQLKSVDEYISNGSISSAVSLLSQISSQLKEIKGIYVVDKIDNITLYFDVQNKLNKLLSSFSMTSLTSTNIVTILGPQNSLELVIKCELNYDKKVIPVRSLPLKTKVVKGNVELQNFAITDADGIAKIKIYNLIAKENIIEVLVDTESFTQQDKNIDYFSNFKIVYHIFAKELKEIKKFAVEVRYRYKNTDLVDFIKSQLISGLKTQGFNIVDFDNADYVIYATVDTEYIGDKITLPDGTQKTFAEIYSGNISVEIKDVKTQSVQLSKSYTALKGFGRTKKEAEENLIKKLVDTSVEFINSNF
jgi:hypothetical protein